MQLMGGVTLLFDFNLVLVCKRVTNDGLSKLSNIVGLLGSCTSVHNFTDAGDGRACSSTSADSIVVAENRRPSSVTVLQTWTCPCKGKQKTISYFSF